MEKSLMLIPQIRTDTRRWTTKITITEDIPVMTCSTGSDLKLKRYVFTDDEGNQTSVSIFGDLINVYSPVLQLYKVYEISNAQVRFVQPQYQILNQPNQWILQRHTLIRPMPRDNPNLYHILDDLTPLSQIASTLKNGIQSVGM
ncbi:hypothetical protein LIER_38949 [Lithospermum erythrorhizon]|uniref:Uncharacterized protein n=1 Tax=Lithospermum erythrorhizon TaxID=34254 RepID=A0AAV3Q7C8_LITER